MIVFYTKFYYWYRTVTVRVIRLTIFCVLLFSLLYFFSVGITPKIPQFLLNMFVIIEVFFHYKVCKAVPEIPVDKNKGKNLLQSFTREALYGFISESKTSEIMKKIIDHPQIKLVLHKTNITHKDFVLKDVSKEILIQSSFDTAK